MVAQHVDYSIILKEMKESGSLGKCEGVPYNNVNKEPVILYDGKEK